MLSAMSVAPDDDCFAHQDQHRSRESFGDNGSSGSGGARAVRRCSVRRLVLRGIEFVRARHAAGRLQSSMSRSSGVASR